MYDTVGVYSIFNLFNLKVYIGSSINLKQRERSHFNALKSNRHYNKHLQRAYNKYGEKYFIFNILENCNADDLSAKEQFYIDFYNSANISFGYNILPTAYSTYGFRHSEETLVAMSECKIGNKNSFYKKSHTEDTKKHLSEVLRGENSTRSKLKESDVLEIYKLVENGTKIKEIAKIYNVKENTISQIKNGQNWKHLYNKYFYYTPNKNKKYENDVVIKIYKLLCEGLSYAKIAEITNVSKSHVCDLKHGKARKDIYHIYQSLNGECDKYIVS